MTPYMEMKLMAEAAERGRLDLQLKLDRVTAERDAALPQLECSRGDFAQLERIRDALQQRLTAADERVDAGIALVTRLIECAGGQPSIATGYLRDILAALNPAEGGGDE